MENITNEEFKNIVNNLCLKCAAPSLNVTELFETNTFTEVFLCSYT